MAGCKLLVMIMTFAVPPLVYRALIMLESQLLFWLKIIAASMGAVVPVLAWLDRLAEARLELSKRPNLSRGSEREKP